MLTAPYPSCRGCFSHSRCLRLVRGQGAGAPCPRRLSTSAWRAASQRGRAERPIPLKRWGGALIGQGRRPLEATLERIQGRSVGLMTRRDPRKFSTRSPSERSPATRRGAIIALAASAIYIAGCGTAPVTIHHPSAITTIPPTRPLPTTTTTAPAATSTTLPEPAHWLSDPAVRSCRASRAAGLVGRLARHP